METIEHPHSSDGHSNNNSHSSNGELIFSESLPDGMSERSNKGLLTLSEIQVRLDTDYSRLGRLAKSPGVAELVGAVKSHGKGMRYEPRAVEMFRRMITALDAGDVTPGTAAAWLRATEATASRTAPETGISEKPIFANSSLDNSGGLPPAALGGLTAMLAPLTDLPAAMQTLAAAITETQQDRLLTAEQVAELLHCSPRSVSGRVPPVLRGRYRASDVQRYIASLEPKRKIVEN